MTVQVVFSILDSVVIVYCLRMSCMCVYVCVCERQKEKERECLCVQVSNMSVGDDFP